MLELLTDDVVFKNYSGDEITSETSTKQEFFALAEESKTYFSDRKQTIYKWRYDENTIIVDIDYAATVAKDLPNGLKKGQKLQLKGSTEFKIKNGKIIEIIDRS